MVKPPSNMTDRRTATVALLGGLGRDLIGTRYPPVLYVARRRIAIKGVPPDQLASLEPDELVGLILEGADGVDQLQARPNVRTLLGVAALLAILERNNYDRVRTVLAAQSTVPYVPFVWSSHTQQARALIADAVIGDLSEVHIGAYVGMRARSGHWANEDVHCRNTVEALAFAVGLAEALTDQVSVAARWLTGNASHSAKSAVLALSGGTPALIQVSPASYSATPGFDFDIRGTSGRVVGRNEFARGSLGHRSASTGWAWVFSDSALPDRSNPQFAETVVGGWETSYAIARLVGGETHEEEIARAVRAADVAHSLVSASDEVYRP